uniref:Uncharacterized protein n=1 Tax=Lepeophtheirus salmonis TaxID=72036 RepID=A0A0K2VKH3_LEPSM
MERIYRLLFMERSLFKHRHGFGAWGVMLYISYFLYCSYFLVCSLVY